MKYSTILLDLDHTLFDSEASEAAALAAALDVAGIQGSLLHSKTYQDINIALWAAVERGELVPQQVRNLRFEKFAEAFKLSADPRLMADTFVSALAANGELYSGAREVIEQLSQRVTLAMVTNGLGEVQRARVERLGIDRHFASIVVSAEVGAAKPGKEIFDIVFSSLGDPDKATALMVGDSLSSDIRGGASYGIATCWYNPHEKSAGTTDRITHEIRELSELLQFAG
jgi:YjjG family noncanonical pyrimidine nucleotidase